MAFRHGIGRVSGITLAAATAKTLLQLIAAANHAIRITEVYVGGQGVSATATPWLVELLRQTTAGTSSALTLVKADDSDGDTLDTTGLQTFTAEPTAGDILRSWTVHPQTGLTLPIGFDAPIICGAGDRIGLRATSVEGITAGAVAYVCFEE